MRYTLLPIAVLMAATLFAQDQWRQILCTNPYLSNGYFIVNQQERQQLNIERLDVDIRMATWMSDGSLQSESLQHLSIEDNFYGKADLSFLDSIQTNQWAYYHLAAYNHAGDQVIDYEGLPPGGGTSWPEQCRQTCNAPSYSWTLHLYSDGAQSQIYLLPGYANGSNFYFYVKQSDWPQFTNQYDPLSFGIWNDWSTLTASNYQGQDVIHYTGGPDDPLPAGARDIDSYLIPTSDLDVGGYAVAKLLGPWAMGDLLVTGAISSGPAQLCGTPSESDLLRQAFNSDPNVMAHLEGRPLLTCSGMLNIDDGGNWNGNSSNFFCTALTAIQEADENGELQVLDWIESVTQCNYRHFELHHAVPVGVKVNNISGTGRNPVVNIRIPTDKDPKLIPVPRTALEPGLYEFTISLDDGTIMRRYQDFSHPVTISADFAAFSVVNIYPVPVKDSFAVDFDLLAPMDIDMTVVDNMGHTYYQKSLHFPVAGRNKHVVETTPQWPGGLYHAIFQYADGSSESLNFTVAQ